MVQAGPAGDHEIAPVGMAMSSVPPAPGPAAAGGSVDGSAAGSAEDEPLEHPATARRARTQGPEDRCDERIGRIGGTSARRTTVRVLPPSAARPRSIRVPVPGARIIDAWTRP